MKARAGARRVDELDQDAIRAMIVAVYDETGDAVEVELIIDRGYEGNQIDHQAPSVRARVVFKDSQ